MKNENRLKSFMKFFDKAFPWVIFFVLLLYSFVFLVDTPYIGFSIGNGMVITVYEKQYFDKNFEADVNLVTVNGVDMEVYQTDIFLQLFNSPESRERITVEYIPLEGGDSKYFDIAIPGFTWNQLLQRVASQFIYGWFFWAIGLFVSISLRPRNLRWRMLVIFLNVFAVFLLSGSVGAYHQVGSPSMLRLVAWLFLPISWHLHLIYPVNLFNISEQRKQLVMRGSYGLFGSLGLLSMFSASMSYAIPFLLGLGGSLVLLVVQAVRSAEARKKLALFFSVQIFTLIIYGAIAFTRQTLNVPISSIGAAMVVFPLIPLGYVYSIYRRQLADIRFRTNPVVVLYLFIMLFVLVLLVVLTILNAFLPLDQTRILSMFVFGLFAAWIAILSYGSFSQWAERKLFGIRLPSELLVHEFTRRLSTSLTTATLGALLKEDVLPSMLVRQSALLLCVTAEEADVLYQTGVDPIDSNTIPLQLKDIEATTRWQFADADTRPLSWVRLAIPLQVEDKRVGLWLFGEHDPDDLYVQKEIDVLETLAAPISIALQNINQAGRLRSLYQVNLKRAEQQRSLLGQDLHDDVVNELSKMVLHLEDEDTAKKIDDIIDLLRDAISGLRPPVLDYGLRFGLLQLSEDLIEEAPSGVRISFTMEKSTIRYNEVAELQLYQIMRQACENALRHAQAKHVQISGELSSTRVALEISDDGIGFEIDEYLDILPLLDAQKFGLAGMLERAELVRATLSINSAFGEGTRVRLEWHPEVLREEDIQFLKF